MRRNEGIWKEKEVGGSEGEEGRRGKKKKEGRCEGKKRSRNEKKGRIFQISTTLF